MTALSPESQLSVKKLHKRLMSPLTLKGFMLAKAPLALAAGVRLKKIDFNVCEATVPYGWRTQNPFRSTYFAALSMAAELATGALAISAIRALGKDASMLIVGMDATFEKKATALSTFRCEDGAKIFSALKQADTSGEPVTVEAQSVGTMSDGTVVAHFTFTWSFKIK